jgi:hypothetical protein
MIENLTAEYVDEISSEMVDLTNTGEEEGDTSRDMSSEKSDEEKMVEEASVSVSVSVSVITHNTILKGKINALK